LAFGVVGASALGSSGDQQHRPCSASSPSPSHRTPLLPFRGPSLMAAAAEGQEEAKTEAEIRAEQDARRKFLWERPRVRIYVHFVRPPSLPSFPPLLHPLDSSFSCLEILFTLFCKLYPCVFLMLYYLTRILPRRFPFPLTPLSYFHSIPSSPSLPPSPAQARMHPPRQVRPRLPGAQNIQWSVPPGASGGSRRHFGGGSWEGDCQFVC